MNPANHPCVALDMSAAQTLRVGRSPWRRVWIATLLILGVATDALMLPNRRGVCSVVGCALKGGPPRMSHANGRTMDVGHNASWALVDGLRVTEWNEADAAALGPERQARAYQAAPGESYSASGLWAITRRKESVGVTFFDASYGFQPTNPPPEVRAAYLDWLAARPDRWSRSVAARARPGNIDRVRIVWIGYVHNAITLGAAALAVIVFPSSATVGSMIRHSPGTCRRCGYNLHGLPSPTCPECGALAAGENTPPA